MRLYRNLSEKHEIEAEQAALTQRLASSEERIAMLNESEVQTAVYQHDMRHHLNAIDGFLAAGKPQQAEEYIRKVRSDIERITPKRYCDNELVNLLCSSFAGKAQRMGVRLEVDAKLPRELSVSDTELCAVLSNALENALRAVKEGYTALKFDLTQTDEKGVCMGFVRVGGLQSAEVLNRVESRMAAIREAVGPDIDILIENHGQTDTAAALQMAKRLEKYHPFAYEDPTYPSAKIPGNIARQTGLPLAHGERLYNRWQFLPMLQSGALQLAQPDLGTCGGITEGKKICDLAQAYDCGVQLHICASNLSIAPALHLETAIPNFTIHEHHVLFLQEDNKKLVRYDYQPLKGYYEVPDLPGLGNEWSDYAFSIAADYATLK